MTESQMVEIIVGIVLFLSTFVRIPKLELNVWGIIGNEIKKGMLKEIDGKIDAIDTKVNALSAQLESVNSHVAAVEEKEEENEAVNCRIRILRFLTIVVYCTFLCIDKYCFVYSPIRVLINTSANPSTVPKTLMNRDFVRRTWGSSSQNTR